MAQDEWDKYIENSNSSSGDEWSQYTVQETAPKPLNKPGVGDAIGSIAGAGAVAGIGYSLAKTGIQQKIGGGIGKVVAGVKNLPKVVNTDKGDAFAKEIRKAFVDVHTEKVNKFGNDLEKLSVKYPDKTVSIAEPVKEIVSNWEEFSPSTKSALKNTPILKSFLKDVKNGKVTGNPDSISLKATQEIINHINTKVPANIKSSNLDLIETLNSVKASQLDAFPEMEQVKSEYKKFIEPYKNVKQYFKFNKLLNGIKDKFGGAEGQAAIEKILPKDVIKKMGGYRAAAKLAEMPGEIPLIGRFLKSAGSMSIAPMATGALLYNKDPQAYMYEMTTGNNAKPLIDINNKLKNKQALTPEEQFIAWKSGLVV